MSISILAGVLVAPAPVPAKLVSTVCFSIVSSFSRKVGSESRTEGWADPEGTHIGDISTNAIANCEINPAIEVAKEQPTQK